MVNNPKEEESSIEGKPPFFSTWGKLYAFVLFVWVLQLLGYYFLTQLFA